MRNEDGVYVGDARCVSYLGVDKIEQHECCGGKVFDVAYCRCELRGVLKAEPDCSQSQCPKMERA
jgi:hypothetical protein